MLTSQISFFSVLGRRVFSALSYFYLLIINIMKKQILIFVVWVALGGGLALVWENMLSKQQIVPEQIHYFTGTQEVDWKSGLEKYPWKDKVGRGFYTNSGTQKSLFAKEMMYFQYYQDKKALEKSFPFYVYTGTLNILLKNLDTEKSQLITLTPKESVERDTVSFAQLWSGQSVSDILAAQVWTDDEMVVFDYDMSAE